MVPDVREMGVTFIPLVWEARTGGMSHETFQVIKRHAQNAGHRQGCAASLAVK